MFLAKFAEAILVDQERANKLPRKDCHPDYDAQMWKRNRENHVSAIVDLSVTVDDMPKRLLKELTNFVVTYQPCHVKQTFLDIISDLATRVSSPWLYETATMFFRELIKDVSKKNPGIAPTGTAVELIGSWFDYDDPIAIAKDPECEYVELLAALIQRESKKMKNTLMIRSKHEFISQRVTKELFDDVFPRDNP